MSSHSRVTILSADRRVDVSLPAQQPVGELLPQLLDLCLRADRVATPSGWTLAPIGGLALPPAASLASARIPDGALLELVEHVRRPAGPVIDDVRDAVEDAVLGEAPRWDRPDTGLAALLVGLMLIAAPPTAAAWGLVREVPGGAPSWAGVGTLVATTSLAGASCWLADRRGLHAVRRGAAGLLLFSGAVLILALCTGAETRIAAGSGLAGGVDGGPTVAAMSLGVALAASLLAAVALGRWRADLQPWTVLAGAACAVQITAVGLLAWGRPMSDLARIFAVVGILAIGAMPRVAIAAGGLAALDHRVRNSVGATPAELTAALRSSRRLLLSGLCVAAPVIGGAAIALADGSGAADPALAALTGLALLLRARAYTERRHVAIIGGAGVLTVLVVGVRALQGPYPTVALGLLIGAGALSALAALTCASPPEAQPARGAGVLSARLRRLLDLSEWLVVLTLIPLAALGAGLFDWLQALGVLR